jgi:glycosyltransferase 2 family protein
MSEKQIAIAALPDSEKPGGFRRSSAAVASGIPATRWFLAGGLLLFALLLWRTRLDHVGELLWQARWAFALVCIPYALVLVCETLGWRFAFPASRLLSFSELLRLTVAAKAVQFLTPSIIQAGEFMKVHLLLESGVKVDMAAASVVVAKTTMMIAELLFIALGLSVALGYVAVEPAVALSVTLGLIIMALCLIGGLFLQHAGLFRPLVWVSRHIRFLAAFIDRHEGLLSSTERIVQAHLTEKRRFAWSCFWFFMGWAAGIVEVWMFMNILGVPAEVPSALFIQVWSLVVTRLTTFIPGGLGAQEAGSIITFSFLGLSAESAMAFAVLRRLRQLGWIAVSLGCLTKASRE